MPENQKGRGNQGGDQGGNRENQSGSKGTSTRGLASADKETRERVAREGGKASHGGGRTSGSGGNQGGGGNRER
jgi:hypothetical protein